MCMSVCVHVCVFVSERVWREVCVCVSTCTCVCMHVRDTCICEEGKRISVHCQLLV